eukprot:scaffold31903_cov57-Attheya_sp.AAC.5
MIKNADKSDISRVKQSSLPGQEQGHLLWVAKKQRTKIHSTNMNQCISKVTGDDCADFIVGTSKGTVVSKLDCKIPPMNNSSGSECDEHDNLQKKNKSVYLNGRSSLMRKERLANLVSIGLSPKPKGGTNLSNASFEECTRAHDCTSEIWTSWQMGQ